MIVEIESSGGSERVEFARPGLSEVEEALRRLDGGGCSWLDVYDDPELRLIVSGGLDGLYVVTVNRGFSEEWWDAQGRLSSREDDVTMRVGGEMTVLPVRLCLCLDEATRAALTFARTQTRDPGLRWIHGTSKTTSKDIQKN